MGVAAAAVSLMAAEGGVRLDTLLADLPAELRAELEATEGPPLVERSPAEQLEAVLLATAPYRFDVGPVATYTDPRWFSALGPSGEGAALMELRRWPGDTVVSIYDVAGPLSSVRGVAPPVPGANLELQPGATEQHAEWVGVLHTDLGDQPARWIEHRVDDSPAVIGALVLPGDAGLGPAAVRSLTEEALGVLRHVEVHAELWPRRAGIPQGTPIQLPAIVAPPAAASESENPWQVALGSSFTLGLPPGFRARRTDAGVPPPGDAVPGNLLWLRGRFTDVEGNVVVVGDGQRAGYVSQVPEPTAEWARGERPPLAVPEGKREASETFALLKEHTGCRSGRAERWTAPGFDGDWLVFRLEFEDRGIEIGLPVLQGRRSASLFWIAASFRGPQQPPAPPPVDPAERFGIRFEQLSRAEKSERPWMEGFMSAPGLRIELPTGWWPAASVRSQDGYPIRLVTLEGATLGKIERLAAGELPDLNPESSGWTEMPRPGVHRADKLYRRADSARLYVSKDGSAFLFEIVDRDGVPPEAWERMASSVQLMRSER